MEYFKYLGIQATICQKIINLVLKTEDSIVCVHTRYKCLNIVRLIVASTNIIVDMIKGEKPRGDNYNIQHVKVQYILRTKALKTVN